MSYISCQNLTVGHDGVPAASGLAFSVSAGEFLCVVGENGSGKSTLLSTILRLRAPLSGQVVMGDRLKRNEIGYLPQHTAARRDFPATVREVVRSGCLNRCGLRPFYSGAEKRVAEENMERLGIAPLAGRCYRELSGGQQRRALLARALCAARKMLLLDEPTAGLDPEAAAELYSLAGGLSGGGLAVVMVSHDLGAAMERATHILQLGGGSALFFGTKAEYLLQIADYKLQIKKTE
jgi:zinc transport system ATP-binding protein